MMVDGLNGFGQSCSREVCVGSSPWLFSVLLGAEAVIRKRSLPEVLAFAGPAAQGVKPLSGAALNASSAGCPSVVKVYSKEDRKSTRLNSSHVAISYAV